METVKQRGARLDGSGSVSYQTASAAAVPHSPRKDLFKKLERFCMAGRGSISVGAERTSHVVHFVTSAELRKWLHLKMVDFAELFPGHGEATVKVREAGCTAADGFDNQRVTYERCWCLESRKDQADLAWLIVYALRPKVVHMVESQVYFCVLGIQYSLGLVAGDVTL